MDVLLKAYLKNNLGDDLFVKIITERYYNNFIVVNGKKNRFLKNTNNLKFKYSLIDKVLKKFIYKYSNLEVKLSNKTKATVIVGGSMFIQYDDINNVCQRNKLFNLLNNQYYIIGTNFGPYKDNKFVEEYKKVFLNAKDVCFRDKYSYDLFNRDLENVRFTNDIVFSMKNNNNKKIEKKSVVISVIDCEKKVGKGFNIKYKKIIQQFIDFFLSSEFRVVLMSFCRYEGDEKIINSIIKKNNNSNISKYFYRGNIEEALNVIREAKVILGSRFHANILGLTMGKTIIPISYNLKTDNMLDDIGFNGKRISIQNIENFDVSLINEKDLNYVCDVSNQKEMAELHFKELDKILDRRY